MKKFIYVILSALLLGNAFLGYRLYSHEVPKDADKILAKLDLFMDVFQQVRANYVDADDVDIDMLFDNAIKGMVYSLDPFSEFMTPSEFQTFQQQEEDSFGGIGVRVNMIDGFLTVNSTIRNTPAAQAGILAGDKIIAIDGEDQKGRTQDEVIAKLRGEPGSTVLVTILRPNEEKPLEIPLQRAIIENESVSDVHVIQGTKTGYLRIEWFMEPTAGQFKSALKELQEQGIDSLIIDLRDNPGGQVNTCVDILSVLLPEDSLIATLEGRNAICMAKYVTYKSDYSFPAEIPIAVLGNRGTASAAEITISSLRDYHRAAFIGERTFGKALVQDVKDLPGGNAIKFTIARYYTKLHTPIQALGIRPDIDKPLAREDYLAIFQAPDQNAIDQVDPNIQAALKFFAEGAQWEVYQGKPEGDYQDILPQWQRDENRQYLLYNYDIYGDLRETQEEQTAPDDSNAPGNTESTEEKPATDAAPAEENQPQEE